MKRQTLGMVVLGLVVLLAATAATQTQHKLVTQALVFPVQSELNTIHVSMLNPTDRELISSKNATRLLVERSCYDEVLEIASRAALAQEVGDPSADGSRT